MAIVTLNAFFFERGYTSFNTNVGVPSGSSFVGTATGGQYSYYNFQGSYYMAYTLGENGNVMRIDYRKSVPASGGFGDLTFESITFSELDIPLALLQANLTNISSLLPTDLVIYGNDLNTSSGYAGRQKITGGTGNDVIYGLGSDDSLYGADGNDRLIGGTGDDALFGGAGNDVLLPGTRGPQGNGGHKQTVDGGDGIDTISFEDLSSPVYLDLAAGRARESDQPNSAPFLVETIMNVENAFGSTGNDMLIGNSSANMLLGGLGNDQLHGGAGNDTLSGSLGNDILRGDEGGDRLDGGAGIDRIDYYNSNVGVNINLATGTGQFGHASYDTFVDIENVYGSAYADVIFGNNGANTLHGNTGNDQLFGGAANDTLYGQAGNDFLRGDAGADIIDGGQGFDRADYYNSSAAVTINLTTGYGYHGDAQGDRFIGIENLFGSEFDDVLAGSAGANQLFGHVGNDRLFGLGGDDFLDGQAGNDALQGAEGSDILSGGDGDDGLFGDAGTDTLHGGNGNDYISGGDDNDNIFGAEGNDRIDAGAGNDYVVLGLGNDGFTLGAGDDSVRFDYGNGQDTIFDFGNGNDEIDFSATDMTLEVLQANSVETSAGVLLQVGSGSILLSGLTWNQLDWNTDFQFYFAA